MTSDLSSDEHGQAFLVDWPMYSNSPIFEHLSAINLFQLSIQFPRFRSWLDSSQMSSIEDCVYEEAYELLRRSGLYHYDQLKRAQTPNTVGVHYEDSDTDFQLQMSNTNELILHRKGSSMERFYEWYRVVMPEMHRVYERIRQFLETLSAPTNGTRREILPARAAFVFKFVLHDFNQQRRGGQTLKNSSLTSSMLKRVPGLDGHLVDLDETQLGSLGRVDLAVSRWVHAPGGAIRGIYDTQAPGNLDYGTLWLGFHYLAETRDEHGGKRHEPDYSAFLRRYDHPVSDFLRDRALDGFLSDLTVGVAFKATPGLLP